MLHGLSVFDLFKVGIGPSSSHTVGPMIAARRFAHVCADNPDVASLRVELFGSLGLTGRGHGTDRAVVLGLHGETPEDVDPDAVAGLVDAVASARSVRLAGSTREVALDPARDLVFHRRKNLPAHPNGMRFTALSDEGDALLERVYYSVGGGFVVSDEVAEDESTSFDPATSVPFPFSSGTELLDRCRESGRSVSGVMLANEAAASSEDEVRTRLLGLHTAMEGCIERGLRQEGVLPGGLNVPRRAPRMHRQLRARENPRDPLWALDWVNLFALAVNEENADGGRVVTAPTNGAAGVLPAVLRYYLRFHEGDDDGVVRFLLAAGAIGLLFKLGASISGAEVGCQGEVGVACAMAAGGLAEALAGTPAQVENAAEIGMEHNLGLTCDPVGGLVQIPCIERNAMGAVKAINAARLALRGDGSHFVSLDKVIRTMRETGADMRRKYKETSRGGLAVNVIEC